MGRAVYLRALLFTGAAVSIRVSGWKDGHARSQTLEEISGTGSGDPRTPSQQQVRLVGHS